MQQQTGQFVYLNGGPTQQQPVGQNVVVMAQGQQPQQQFAVLAPAQTPMHVQINGVAGPYSGYSKKTSRVMGAMQIGLAVLMIGLNIGMAVANDNLMWTISTGWWATPFMIIAGSFGIAAGSRTNRCTVVTTMVLSIVSCVFMISVFTQAGLGIAAKYEYCFWYYYGTGRYWTCDWHQTESNLALYILFILAGLTELGVGITQSVICCNVLFCGRQTPQTYVTNHGQNYTNGGFVPCYIHPQGGAIGQSIPMTSIQNMQNTVMATGVPIQANTVAMPASQMASVPACPPPAYFKEESTAQIA